MGERGDCRGGQAASSLTTGRVTAANRKTYDLANASDHKRIIEEGFVFLLDEVRAAIRKMRAYISANQAADALVSWQRQSCA
jgi:hypothetical protein